MMTEKYDEAFKTIHEQVCSCFTEEERKGYELFCKFMHAYEREETLCRYEFERLAREETNAKREEATSCQ